MSSDDETDVKIVDSEECLEVYCDACIYVNQQGEAKGYCKTCSENLCSECINIHKQKLDLGNHVIEDRVSTDTDKVGSNTVDDDPLTDCCPQHPDEIIKFHCNDHQIVCCSVCIMQNHRHCDDIDYVREIASNIIGNGELESLQDKLNNLVLTLELCKSRSENHSTVLTNSYTNIIEEIKNLRKEWNNLLDELENQLLESATAMKDKNMKCLTETMNSCDAMKAEIQKLLQNVEDRKNLGQNNSLFISFKQSQDTMNKMDHTLIKEIIENTGKVSFVFQSDEIVEKVTSLGTVSLGQYEQTNINAEYSQNIIIRTGRDTEDCFITGSTCLDDGRLVLCDTDNQSIKVVSGFRVTEQIRIPYFPGDITLIDGNRLAVTMIGRNELLVMTYNPKLSGSHVITLPGVYKGITYSKGKFILANTNEIHICDITGKLIKKIPVEADNSTRRGICLSPTHDKLYVTDAPRHAVICMTLDGEIVHTYTSEKIKAQSTIAINQDGNLYIGSSENIYICRVTPLGQITEIALKEDTQPIVLDSTCDIACTPSHIYISNNSSDSVCRNNVRVFRIVENMFA